MVRVLWGHYLPPFHRSSLYKVYLVGCRYLCYGDVDKSPELEEVQVSDL